MIQLIAKFFAFACFVGLIFKFAGVIIHAANRHFQSKEPVVANTFDDCKKPYDVLGEMKDGPVTPTDSVKDAVFCLFATIITLIGLAFFIPLVLATIVSCVRWLAS